MGWVALAASVLIILVGAGGLGWAGWADNHPLAVVGPGPGALMRIPGRLALNWLELPAGTTVHLTASEQGHYLVETGYGLEGWLSEETVLVVGDTDGLR